MTESYFRRVRATTPTRLWINNPTLSEIDVALSQGAAGCTTNPAYGGNLLRRAPEYARSAIESVLKASPQADDETVAALVQQRLVSRVAEGFMPLFERSGGTEGLVSIQGSPLRDDDEAQIFNEAADARAIAPNATPKIPATAPGLTAFEALVEIGTPTILTEVFSLAQLIEANERYLRAARRSGLRPAFFVSPITGIFGDHLRAVADRAGVVIAERVVRHAGVVLARRCNALVEERRYPSFLLFGGARTIEDFTGLVGAPTAATINCSTVDEIVAADPPVDDTIHAASPGQVIRELTDTFEDFRRALAPDGVVPEEFEAFGPVQHFRASFVSGWRAVLDATANLRAGQLAAADSPRG